MLPGFSGHLVSEFYIESHLASTGTDRHGPEIGRARQRFVAWRRQRSLLGPASSLRALLEAASSLVALLGFEPPIGIEPLNPALVATIVGGRCATALLVVGWGERLDPLWRLAVTHAMRRSAPWCLLFNGTHLRIVDAGRLYARRYTQFDLDLVSDDERTFAAFWSLTQARTLAVPAEGCATALHALVDDSARQASSVCRALKDGVLAASADVLGALAGRARSQRTAPASLHPPFEQALTIVYRMLFLLFAESRGLVPLWHPVYRESYSLEALCTLAARAGSAPGLWDALRAITRLAHAGCRAGDLRVTPFNGRLFSPARTPLAERRDLDDEAARRALLAVSTRLSRDRAGRERIAYRDLGVEQLGAVYETLLDYRPRMRHVPPTPRRGPRTTVELEPAAGIRKATGTFYTPQPLAEYLVRRTLAPLVRTAAPEEILRLRVVDPAMGSGAFLVAACRYLAGTYEDALVREGGYTAGDFGESERAAIRRTIAKRCLYGVDVNPMAVQLARLSIWLATLASDCPLTFLDHRLQAGDSLLGAWLSHLRHPPDPRRRQRQKERSALPLFDDEVRTAVREALPVRFGFESVPDDTLDRVRSKEHALAALNRRDAALSKWKRVADLWCAAWFLTPDASWPPSAFGALTDAILAGGGALPEATTARCLYAAEAVATARRFFHWELEFPEVFFEAEGTRRDRCGFDAVIGNPPWDMIRADAGCAEARARARSDATAIVRFTRDSGVYTAQSSGHANRYQLFLERAIVLTRPGGRIGLVLPSGLAADHGSARLRRQLFRDCNVDALVGFQNQRGVFPVHRSVRFLLLTASRGSPTREIACRFGERDPGVLEAAGEEPGGGSAWFSVRVTPALLERLSGASLAIPDLRTITDVAIAERAAALFPPLSSASGWNAHFGRELNATGDRAYFHPGGAGLPVVEGKQIEPFRPRIDAVRHHIAARDARRLLADGRYDRPRLAYRDVASATNRLTLIAAMLPAGCVSTHTVFCLRSRLATRWQHFLCGMFNSFLVNYFVRLRVTTHVTTEIVEGLPIPCRHDAPGLTRGIAALARLLVRGPDTARSASLNANVARLYQLSVAEFEHVLGTFPLVPREERDAALEAFRGMNG